MELDKDLVIPEVWAEKFDFTVKQCGEALTTGKNTIKNSVVVMNGIRSLKKFFHLPAVKELIEMSKDNRAGFLTDRSPAQIFKHNANPNKRYELKPYTYDQIVEALLPCILEGYRPHGNEINIISGTGMPVKRGKYNKIIEMTDGFQENISTPAIKDGHAFMKCRAKWIIDGETQEIGYQEGDEVHIKLSFGKWDSMDKVRGLAQSKLYTQVLTRITGRFISDDPTVGAVDITDEVDETEEEKKGKPSPFGAPAELATKSPKPQPDKPSSKKRGRPRKEAKPREKLVKEEEIEIIVDLVDDKEIDAQEKPTFHPVKGLDEYPSKCKLVKELIDSWTLGNNQAAIDYALKRKFFTLSDIEIAIDTNAGDQAELIIDKIVEASFALEEPKKSGEEQKVNLHKRVKRLEEIRDDKAYEDAINQALENEDFMNGAIDRAIKGNDKAVAATLIKAIEKYM